MPTPGLGHARDHGGGGEDSGDTIGRQRRAHPAMGRQGKTVAD